jgi:ligand-binding sensor domain-containing protein
MAEYEGIKSNRMNGQAFMTRQFSRCRIISHAILYVLFLLFLTMPTFDSGVSVSKQETVVDVMNEAEGLDANSVRAIVKSSDGNYYIGTSGNLQIFSFEEPEAGSGTAGAGTNDSAQKTSKTANDAAASEKSGGLKLLGTLT